MQPSVRLAITVFVMLVLGQQGVHAAPGEATNLRWCPGSVDCLGWDAASPPGDYRVLRGTTASLPGLVDGSVDSCRLATFAGTSTGPVVGQLPPAGGLFWYLVVATTCPADGTAGNGSFGPRVVNSSGDCAPANCTDGLRNGAESDVDCGGGACPPCASGQRCCAGIDCAASVCLLGSCAGASCSDGTRNGNETDVDCGGGTCPACVNGRMCAVASDCLSLVCSGNLCAAPSCSDLVRNGNETDVDCGGGACPACVNGRTCAANGDCLSGLCQGGICQGASNGSICTSGSQCSSGSCADGVCCNTVCGGTCQRCDSAGSVGTCSNVVAGADPDNECAAQAASTCGQTGACSGAGSCQLHASGTVCTAPSCSSSTASNAADVCNGAGTCLDGGVTNCVPFTCNAGTGLCATSCGTDTNCASGYYCLAGSCLAKKFDGSICSFGNECNSGSCTDGVCCNTACSGLCQRCNNAGSVGTCSNVIAGGDPDNECSTQAPSTCGQTGVCSGVGSCQRYASGTVCVAPSCASSTTSNATDTCNGAGTCLDGGVTNCVPFTCNAGTGLCATSCTIDSNCAPGYSCASGLCKKSNGSICSVGSECSSGSCTDGVCCNTACSGLCQRCNNAGSLGTCSNVAAGTDPDNECSGTCNGAGGCTP